MTTLVYSNKNTLSPDSVKDLRADFRGEILLPEDPGYEDTRKIWNAMIEKRPAVIARCLGASDVMKAVKFARERGLVVSVRGGGHNVAGNSVCDGGVMIDLSLMKSVRVDPVTKKALAEGGVTWRQFDLETQAFGLATTGGLVSSTGIAGFTLGGGIGWLVRKYGLALDNLVSVDLVTAKGEMVRASMSENPDLFWGVRGGGGNFGIVTSFEYALHSVGPIILGGLVAHRAEEGKELLKFYRDFVKDAPDELTTLVVYLTGPPAPFLPKEFHGARLIAIAACYSGKDIEEGKRLLTPLRRYGKPILDLIGPMPYTVLQHMFDESAPRGLQNYWKSAYLSDLSDEAIEVILSFGESITSPFSAIHIHHLGGAIQRTGEDATSFGHREASFALNIPTSWVDPSEKGKHVAWTREFFAAMQRFTRGAYVNFMTEDDAGRVKEAYGEEKYAKLVLLKNKYDPTNFFSLNQNILPTVAI